MHHRVCVYIFIVHYQHLGTLANRFHWVPWYGVLFIHVIQWRLSHVAKRVLLVSLKICFHLLAPLRNLLSLLRLELIQSRSVICNFFVGTYLYLKLRSACWLLLLHIDNGHVGLFAVKVSRVRWILNRLLLSHLQRLVRCWPVGVVVYIKTEATALIHSVWLHYEAPILIAEALRHDVAYHES